MKTVEWAVLLIDHGSRRLDAHEGLISAAETLAQVLRNRGQPSIVEIAHMELVEPSIAQAIERCVEQGAVRIKVVPCFLSRGRHVTEDVPAQLNLAAQTHPQLRIEMSPPLLELPGFIAMLADHLIG